MAGEHCRTGCRERTHSSYAECLRAARPSVTMSAAASSAWDQELGLYADARRQGIQPASTRTPDILSAVEFSDRHGVAFDAGDGAGSLVRAGVVEEG